jgi:hypothetical protein
MQIESCIGLKCIASLQEDLDTSPLETGGQSEVERVSDTIDDIEQNTDVEGLVDRLWTDACRIQGRHIALANFVRMEGELFQIAQHGLHLLVDRRCLPVIKHRLGQRIAQGF